MRGDVGEMRIEATTDCTEPVDAKGGLRMKSLEWETSKDVYKVYA